VKACRPDAERHALRDPRGGILQPAGKACIRRDRLGEGERDRVPFVGRLHAARAHVVLGFELEPGVAVVGVGRAAGVGLQAVEIVMRGEKEDAIAA
jgi:hypothetical protein